MNDHFKLQLVLAAGLVKKKQFDQALSVLKAMDETYGQDELVLGMMAGVYFQIGMVERAEFHYRKVLNLNPNNGLALLQLGLAQIALDRPAAAVVVWRPLLLDQQNFMAYFHTGLALLEMGRQQEAIDHLLIATANMPADHPYREKAEELILSATRDINPGDTDP